VCSWVLRNLTGYYTTVQRVQMCSPVGCLRVKAFCNGSSLGMKYGPSTAHKKAMKWHHPTSRKKKFKDIPSAGKVMTTVFWDAQGVTSVGIMPRGQTNNSNLYIQTFKTSQKHFRSSISPKWCWNPLSTRQPTTTHKFESRKQSQNSDELFFPTHHTAQILLPQNYTSLEPVKMSSVGRGVVVMTWLLKKLISGCEYGIQTGTRTGWRSCFSLSQGCWSWWTLPRKTKCVLHPSSYSMSQFK